MKLVVILCFFILPCFASEASLEKMWSTLYHEANFGYTLVGSKPVSLQSWSRYALSICPKVLEFYLDGPARAEWEKFSIDHPSSYYALIFRDICVNGEEFGEVILINKRSLMCCFETHRELFEKYITFSNLSPETIVLETFKSCNYQLIGIILGYGPHNSMYFQRHADIENYFRHLGYFPYLIKDREELFYLEGHTNNIDLSYDALVPELKKRKSDQFQILESISSRNPLSLVHLPGFMALKGHPETQASLEKYQQEQKRVVQLGLQKPLLDSILKIYFNGNTHD